MVLRCDNGIMSRGWESKSVESQMDAAETVRTARKAPQKSPEEIEKESKLVGLMLSRTRVLRDMEMASNTRRKAQLEAALAYLDAQIAKLG